MPRQARTPVGRSRFGRRCFANRTDCWPRSRLESASIGWQRERPGGSYMGWNRPFSRARPGRNVLSARLERPGLLFGTTGTYAEIVDATLITHRRDALIVETEVR